MTNRVVGFTLLKIFQAHESLVTSLALVNDEEHLNGIYLLSAGWDRRICVWDLRLFTIHTVFCNPNPSSVAEAEMASLGSILDMDYSPKLRAFAYASSDNVICVRKFSVRGNEMRLMYKLDVQVEAEITCLKWNFLMDEWIAGLENGEIRIWVKHRKTRDDHSISLLFQHANGEFKQAVNVRGTIHSLCIDYVQKALLIGTQDSLKVFDMEEYNCVQVNAGHTDVIRYDESWFHGILSNSSLLFHSETSYLFRREINMSPCHWIERCVFGMLGHRNPSERKWPMSIRRRNFLKICGNKFEIVSRTPSKWKIRMPLSIDTFNDDSN